MQKNVEKIHNLQSQVGNEFVKNPEYKLKQ